MAQLQPTPSFYTAVESIPQIVSSVRAGFENGVTRPLKFRIAQLKAIIKMLEENEGELVEAIQLDLKKPTIEIITGEIVMVVRDCRFFLKNLHKLARAKSVALNDMLFALDKAKIVPEPRGVVLIIAPWNFPLQLAMLPLVGAIAAGNAAIIKPSEISSHTSELMSDLARKYLDTSVYQFVNGGAPESTALLQERFDHIFYTGNGVVGRIVMQAAVKHLTPVVLELGGKCPAIITADVNIESTCKRIAVGKFINAGQVCIGIDHVLCEEAIYEKFLACMAETVRTFYGENPEISADYGRIISRAHWSRVMKLIDADRSSARVICGGTGKEEERYIAPTILADVTPESEVMKSEIFGPVLPVLKVKSVEEAISMINKGEKPLALNIFTKRDHIVEQVLAKTSSGSVCVNDSVVQAAANSLPFGGVGESGMGNYHGKFSFEAFSHKKTVLLKSHGMEFMNDVRYPPIVPWKEKAIRMVFGWPAKKNGSSKQADSTTNLNTKI